MSEKKRIQSYRNESVTVRFDPNICEHSAICIRNLPAVFDLKGRPWVNVNGAPVEDIVELVKRCPSGALTYELAGEASPAQVTASTITVIKNGPLRLEGTVKVVDGEGNVLLEADKCSLCRCGASQNKPFCDGSHRAAGFVG